MSKKVVLFIILAMVVASIFILGIFAPEIGQTVITYKVEGVEFNKEDYIQVVQPDGETYDEYVKLDKDVYTYQLEWKIYPIDEEGTQYATNQKVSFSSNNPNVTVSNEGLVTFASDIEESIKVTITIKTSDGEKTDSIDIFKEYQMNANW